MSGGPRLHTTMVLSADAAATCKNEIYFMQASRLWYLSDNNWITTFEETFEIRIQDLFLSWKNNHLTISSLHDKSYLKLCFWTVILCRANHTNKVNIRKLDQSSIWMVDLRPVVEWFGCRMVRFSNGIWKTDFWMVPTSLDHFIDKRVIKIILFFLLKWSKVTKVFKWSANLLPFENWTRKPNRPVFGCRL
jgi:hypothetical protein